MILTISETASQVTPGTTDAIDTFETISYATGKCALGIRAIPVGRTVTYSDVACWVGPMTSARAVAGAFGSNPIALAVPCQRVVRSNGDFVRYRWGVERKRDLIRKAALS
jgi:O-6-methylguanine DNA methyltransferase